VHPGDRVRAFIDASAAGAGDPGIEGVVGEVARAVGADQRTFTVKVKLPSNVTARSGSFARVVFQGPARRVLLVPAEAIQRHGQVASVYVVQGDVARLRLVQLGASTMQGVEVLAGLDPGESIVAAPVPRLDDGSRVTVGGASTTADGKS
jgi:hypothetical protein